MFEHTDCQLEVTHYYFTGSGAISFVPMFEGRAHPTGDAQHGRHVACRALADAKFDKVRNIVMFGPPGRGSRVAAVLAKGLGWFCRPLADLSDAENSFVNTLALPDGVDVGIIAASFDRVLSVESTHLPTERDHLVVPSGHTSMLFRSDVAEYTAAFLRQGHFGQTPALGGSRSEWKFSSILAWSRYAGCPDQRRVRRLTDSLTAFQGDS